MAPNFALGPSDIEPDSFHWTAEHSADSIYWRKVVDIRARRV